MVRALFIPAIFVPALFIPAPVPAFFVRATAIRDAPACGLAPGMGF
jgi:hypothetical protein